MKKTNGYTTIELLLLILGIVILASSCAGTKKDCEGVKHYKHKNGFYI